MDSVFFSRLDKQARQQLRALSSDACHVPLEGGQTRGQVSSFAVHCQPPLDQDLELRKPRKQLEFLWRGSPIYGSYGDLFTYAMETGGHTWSQSTCMTLLCVDQAASFQ